MTEAPHQPALVVDGACVLSTCCVPDPGDTDQQSELPSLPEALGPEQAHWPGGSQLGPQSHPQSWVEGAPARRAGLPELQ